MKLIIYSHTVPGIPQKLPVSHLPLQPLNRSAAYYSVVSLQSFDLHDCSWLRCSGFQFWWKVTHTIFTPEKYRGTSCVSVPCCSDHGSTISMNSPAAWDFQVLGVYWESCFPVTMVSLCSEAFSRTTYILYILNKTNLTETKIRIHLKDFVFSGAFFPSPRLWYWVESEALNLKWGGDLPVPWLWTALVFIHGSIAFYR